MKNRLQQLFISISLLMICCMSSLQAEVVLRDIKGGNIPFSSLKGKWVMINFWASWCQPCLDEIAELNAFYKAHQEKVALFAVNFDALPLADQLVLIKQLGIRYPSLSENPSGALRLGNIRGVPATFVFDPEGHFYDSLYGGLTQRALRKVIATN